MPPNTNLDDFDSMSWNITNGAGYASHVDVFLDNGETLVFEYAKVDPNDCDDSGDYPIGNFSTFDDKGIINNSAYAWLSSGSAGPCGNEVFDANHKNLSDWKTSYSNANISKIEIEVDNWILQSEAYIENVLLIIGNDTIILDAINPNITSSSISGAYFNGTNYIISPNGDGLYDNVSIDLEYSETVDYSIYIINSTGNIVKNIYSGTAKNPTAKTWDGTNDSEEKIGEDIYFIKTNITDLAGNSKTLEIVTIFIKNPKVSISSSSPVSSEIIVKVNGSQLFSVFATESESTDLNYSWYIDSVLNQSGTNSSFVYGSSTTKDFEILVNITNVAKDYATNQWTLIVTNIPIANTFTGSGTTNFSAISNLSSATNIVLAESDGKIDFRSEVLDLSNVLDLDRSVKINNGIVAIDTSTYPQLNKSATITLTGLSYNTIPKIFYSNGFTTTASEITAECDFCNITSYTNSPTSDGTVVFEVEHFSSFKVGGSGIKYDLNSFDDVDLCEEGIIGDLELEIKKPDDGDDFQIGDTINIKVKVTNNADEDKDIIVEASLYNIGEDDEEENVESNDEEINEGDSETFKLEIEVPDDFDDSDDYVIFVKAYEDGEEETQCNQDVVEISLEREKHDVIIKGITITSQIVYSSNKINVFVDVENVGSKDEDVYVVIENSALGIYEKSETFELEEYGDDDFSTQMFFVKIPRDAKEGDYLLSIKAVFDGGSDKRTETISVLRTLLLAEFDRDIISLKYKGEETEIIKAEKDPKKLQVIGIKKLPDDNYVLVFVLGFGILILILLIIVVLNSRKRLR